MAEKLKDIKLYAWLGEDEMTPNGEIGLKQARVPAGYIPMVAIDESKMDRGPIIMQLDLQGKTYHRRISLCEFKFSRVIKEVGEKD